MKRLLFGYILLMIGISAFSQNAGKNIYSGGMLILQSGYTITENRHQEIKHVSFGIGGILRFYFCKYFTVGIYGGTQKIKYNSTNSQSSYINLGYGGPLLGFSQKTGKIRYTVSAFIGGGKVKNLHIESQNDNMLIEAYLYKNSTIVISPILSFDYAMSQRLFLTLQTVCLVAKLNNDNTLYNPAFQIGVLFYR